MEQPLVRPIATPVNPPKGFRGDQVFDFSGPTRQEWLSGFSGTAGTKNMVNFRITKYRWFRLVSFIHSFTIGNALQLMNLGYKVYEGIKTDAELDVINAASAAIQIGTLAHTQAYGPYDSNIHNEIIILGRDGSQMLHHISITPTVYSATPLGIISSDQLMTEVPLPDRKVFQGETTLSFGYTILGFPANNDGISSNRVRICVQGVTADDVL